MIFWHDEIKCESHIPNTSKFHTILIHLVRIMRIFVGIKTKINKVFQQPTFKKRHLITDILLTNYGRHN